MVREVGMVREVERMSGIERVEAVFVRKTNEYSRFVTLSFISFSFIYFQNKHLKSN